MSATFHSAGREENYAHGAQRARQPKQLAAGPFQPAIDSFRLHLAAEGKSDKTVRTYVEAAQWFAAEHLLRETDHTDWDEVEGQDIQRWMVWLLDRYSDSYANNQYRAIQQFFKWWSAEEELPDPTAKLRPPKVDEKLAPVFSEEELQKLVRSCEGRTFIQRRDHAIISALPAFACPSWRASVTSPMTLSATIST